MLDPSYLRSIRDGILNGTIEANNNEALPDGLVGLYDKELFSPTMKWKERSQLLHFFLVFALAQKEISADFAAEILGDDWYDQAEDNTSKEEKRLQRVNELIQVHSKRFSSAGGGKYRLYHERFRVYVLQKVSEEDIAQFNNKFIALCEKALEVKKEKDIPEKESYALEFITTHFYVSAMQGVTECLNKEHAAALKKYAYAQQFWERQISLTQRYVLPKLSLDNLIRWGTKFDDKRIIFETNLKLIELANIEIKRTSQDSLIELVKLDFELAISRIQDLQIDAKSKFKLILSVFQYFQEHDLVCQNAKNVLKLIQLLKNDEALRKITVQSIDVFPFFIDWYRNEISLEIIYEDKTKFLHRLENFAEWWMEHHLAKSSDFEYLLIHYINNYQETENIRFKLFQYYIKTNINRCIEIVSKENEDSTILPQFYFELLEYYLESNFEECKTIFNDKKFKSSKFYSLLRDGWYESSKKRFIEIARIFTEKSFQESDKLDFDLCFVLHKKVDAEKQFANICAKYFDTSFAFDFMQINSSKIIQYGESFDYCYLQCSITEFFLNFLKAKVNQKTSLRKLRFLFGYYKLQDSIHQILMDEIGKIESKYQIQFIPENILQSFIDYYLWLVDLAIILRNHGQAVTLLKKCQYYLELILPIKSSDSLIHYYSNELAKRYLQMGIINKWINEVENLTSLLKSFNCSEIDNQTLQNKSSEKETAIQRDNLVFSKNNKSRIDRRIDFLLERNYLDPKYQVYNIKNREKPKNENILIELDKILFDKKGVNLQALDFLMFKEITKYEISFNQAELIFQKFKTYTFQIEFVKYCIQKGPLSSNYFRTLKEIESSSNEEFYKMFNKFIKSHILPKNLQFNVLIEFFKKIELKKDERVDLLKKFIIHHLIDKANNVEIKIEDHHSINLKSIIGLIWNHDEKTIDQHLFELAKV